MTETLHTKGQHVLRLYREIDDATRAFQQASGLTCPPGCGRCCENPRVSATVVELLPMAASLLDEGRADAIEQAAVAARGKWCVFFESSDDGKGRCGAYALRPAICRLFGFAGVRRKRGLLELAPCAVHSMEQPDVVTETMERVDAGLPMPVFSDAERALMVMDPVDGKTQMPINEALVHALHKVRSARAPAG